MSGYPFVSPIPGAPLTSGFAKGRVPPKGGGKPRRHAGVDLDGNVGDPVRAAGPGVVAKVQSGRASPRSQAEVDAVCASPSLRAGNYVEIDHADGYRTRYLHLASVRVREGQPVHAGDVVGIVGLTGCITGSHLHFEVLEGGSPINPMLVVDIRGEGWRPQRIASGTGDWVYRQFEDGIVEVIETPDGKGVGMRLSPDRADDARALAAIVREIGPFRAPEPREDWSDPAHAVAMELQDDVRSTAKDALATLTLSTSATPRPGELLLALAPTPSQAVDAGMVALGAAGVVGLGVVGWETLRARRQGGAWGQGFRGARGLRPA